MHRSTANHLSGMTGRMELCYFVVCQVYPPPQSSKNEQMKWKRSCSGETPGKYAAAIRFEFKPLASGFQKMGRPFCVQAQCPAPISRCYRIQVLQDISGCYTIPASTHQPVTSTFSPDDQCVTDLRSGDPPTEMLVFSATVRMFRSTFCVFWVFLLQEWAILYSRMYNAVVVVHWQMPITNHLFHRGGGSARGSNANAAR
mmetsp:Transcript_29360/g.52804  ORF Transcript_29360/g.52804 Transcript_29360/m.52804 type:complete len:200 (-) Transcript_29360:384-983(-)